MAHRLSVLGTGYLGATHAVCMAEMGYEVIGMDVDPAKIAKLQNGEVPFFEPGLEPLLRKNIESGRLTFTTSYEEAGRFGDVHFICVGTPQKKGEYAADMTYVNAVTHGILPYVSDGDLLVGQVDGPGRHGRAAHRRGPGERARGRQRRALLEPRVPPRGLRGRGHADP